MRSSGDQRWPIDEEALHAGVGVQPFEARPVATLRGPDPGQPPPEATRAVFETDVELGPREAFVEQWQERVRRRATEQLDDAVVGQSAEDGGRTMPPRRLEHLEPATCE